MTTLGYQDALDFLFPRVTTIKFGLDTTRALLAALGDPHRLCPIIHVAGTNGKGSVSTLAARALGAAGWKVGLYTSPHLVSFRERIEVDQVPISESAVAMWTSRLMPLIQERQATFFEVTTAMAFADFAARGAEVVVAEVGLGGRLDSTNVVEPAVSVVTRIARDHMKYLGDTLEAIAREKAGIAKPGVPFVIGESNPALVTVLREAARAAVRARRGGAADVRVVPPGYRWDGPLGLEGGHQRRNAGVAYAALMALPEPYRPTRLQVEEGFSQTRVPGRFDRRGRWLFDVAHNPDGMTALTAAIRESRLQRPIRAVVSILGDKEWPEMLALLDGVVDGGILTIAPTTAGRRWELAEVAGWLREHPGPGRRWELESDFPTALKRAQQMPGTIVVTGSFHTVGDALSQLGLS
ncbi:MAG TPA: Mur ligase family protein [Gemmatimonadales bacterium]|nr:Mur ligase family protein [Gemmatimonadales bacterium]